MRPGDIDRVKGVMKDVVDFFSASSESGKEVRTVMKDLVSAFVEGLFGVDIDKSGGVKETLQALLDVVKGSKSDVKEFAAGIAAIGKAFGWIAGIAGDVSSAKAIDRRLFRISASWRHMGGDPSRPAHDRIEHREGPCAWVLSSGC